MKTSNYTEIAGLYIHIPFCISKCHYCDFYSSTDLKPIEKFVAALLREMPIYRNTFSRFDTIYIGGGTPSLLNHAHFKVIFEKIASCFILDDHPEITIEVNPGDITPSYLEELVRSGFNRINIGIQSFDSNTLNFLGRRHTREKAHAALAMAKSAGFSSVGADLIYGIPGRSPECWKADIESLLSYEPDHISCYELTLEKDTYLGKRLSKGEFSLPPKEHLRDLFFNTSATLSENGYLHYEVSNFARNISSKSRHNRKYWQHAPYLGLGPSAHSFTGEKRWSNVSSVSEYIDSLNLSVTPVGYSEILTDDQLMLEFIYLGFRTTDGIDLDILKKRFGRDLVNENSGLIENLIMQRYIIIDRNYLRPTTKGMAVADSLGII